MTTQALTGITDLDQLGFALCAAALGDLNFEAAQRCYAAGQVPMPSWSAFCSRVRAAYASAQRSGVPLRSSGAWAAEPTVYDLRDRPLEEVEDHFRQGRVTWETFQDYCQYWRLGAPRFSNLYEEWEDQPVRPRVAEMFRYRGEQVPGGPSVRIA